MAISVQQVITEARGLLQDAVQPYRYTDADLVQYASDCLDVMSDHLPHMFVAIVPFTCVAGARQAFSAAGSKGLVRVIETSNGNAVSQCDRSTLDIFAPKWRTTTKAAPASEWMPMPGDRYTFDVYPPAPAQQVLNVMHVVTPPELSISSMLDERLTAVSNLITDYVVGLAEAREAEDVGPQREQLFVASFINKLKGMK